MNEWAGVARNQSGTFIFAFGLSGTGANNLGKDIIDQLKLFEPQTAQDLHQGLLDLLAQVRKAAATIQFACALVEPNKLVFGSFGGTIVIKKSGGTKELIGSSDQLQLIEGRRSDLLAVLATDASKEYVAEIRDRLDQGYELSNITSALMSAIQSDVTPAQLAIAFLECAALDATTTSQLLAQATASSALKHEPAIQPTISIESIEADTQPTPASAQHTVTTRQLPTRPTPFTRLRRDGLQTARWLIQRGIQLGKRGGKTLGTVGVRSARQVALAINRVPQLKTAYQAADTNTQKKIWFVVIGMVLLVLAAIGFGVWKNQQLRALERQYEIAIQKPNQLRSEAEGLLTSDPVLAREKAGQAVTELEQLRPQFDRYYQLKTKLESAITTAQTFATEISGQQELSDLQVFFDLRLTDGSFLANSIYANGATLYFLDQEKRQVVELSRETKQFNLLTLSGNQPIRDWAVAPKNMYVLGEGITSYTLADTQATQLKEVGDSDRDGTLLRQFDAYLYVFNPIKRNIFRFTFTSSGLSQGIGWITDKKNLDFNQVRDMTVDGSVWLTTKDGKILKYVQGQSQSFVVEGLADPFNSPLQISTAENDDNLYLLEPGQQRVVILSKNGKLIRQIKSAALSAATDIAIADNPRSLFVLSGSTVYNIPL